MRELRRVLRPDGWAILQSPVDSSRAATYEDWSVTRPVDRLNHFGQEDHVRVYGLDYEQRLRQAGFAVTVVRYPEELGTDKVRRHSLQPDEWIYLCRKASSEEP
jgi:acetyl esterase/lipase